MNNYHNYSDSQLIERLQAGDSQSFNCIMTRHSSVVKTVIVQNTQDPDIVDDILQETFLKALLHLTDPANSHDKEGNLRGWLCRIAHNKCIDYFRRQKRRIDKDPILFDGEWIKEFDEQYEKNPEEIRIKREQHLALQLALRTLPGDQYDVVMMRHYGEMAFKEIASVTEVSINTTLGRMRYALNNLRKLNFQDRA